MTSKIRALMACFAVAGLATPASAGGLRVLSAQYGNPQTGELCNAAAPIAAICDGHHQCSFEIRNVVLCGDPSFLVVKNLSVKYTCGVGHYKATISEYDTSNLACR